MVIDIPLPAANVKVSVALSATTSLCPLTAIVLNVSLTEPLPEEAIVTESLVAFVVSVMFEPAIRVSVSLLESATTSLCPETATVPNAFPPADIELNDRFPEPSVTNACPFVPSDVGYVKPATTKLVPFNNCNESDLNLAVITLAPAFLFANSIKPSSVVSVLSCIFAVIFAYTTSWSASFSPLNLSCPK